MKWFNGYKISSAANRLELRKCGRKIISLFFPLTGSIKNAYNHIVLSGVQGAERRIGYAILSI